MIEQFIEFLKSIHLKPDSLPDGRIHFMMNDLHFIFEWKDDDPSYVRILLPTIDYFNDQKTEIITSINRSFKVAKLIVVDNEIWAVAESFIASKININFIFSRLIQLLIDVYNSYYESKQHSKK